MMEKTHYCGGNEAMSDIDRDKISLPELVGHLRDHCVVKEGMLMHWLFPGKELENGLRVLVDDKACQYMSDCITDGGVAEIYVEDEPTEMEEDEDGGEANASDFEDEHSAGRNVCRCVHLKIEESQSNSDAKGL